MSEGLCNWEEVPLLSTVLIPDMGLLQRGGGCGRGGQGQYRSSDMGSVIDKLTRVYTASCSHDDSRCTLQISSLAPLSSTWKTPFITLHAGIGHTCPVNSVSGFFIRCIRKNLQEQGKEEKKGQKTCTLTTTLEPPNMYECTSVLQNVLSHTIK